MTISKIAISLSLLLAITTQAFADTQPQDTTPTESTSLSKSEIRTYRRDSIRANKKVWTSILGGPSYTPEASAGVAAAVLMSFRMNESDTISQRSLDRKSVV